MDEQLIKLGITLGEIISRNTVSMVSTRIEAAKLKKNQEEQALAYTEIINNLLADKEDLVTITREYKQEIDNVVISDSDIEYLHNTLEQFLVIFRSFSSKGEEHSSELAQVIQLLNKDTLKTMQLLGFNYKEAIGIPLTQSCSEFIRTKLTTNKHSKHSRK